MTEPSPGPPAPTAPSTGSPWLVLGLLLCPLVAAAVQIAPSMGERGLPIGAAAGLLGIVLALAVAARAVLSRGVVLASLVLAIAWIVYAYFAKGFGFVHLVVAEIALLVLGHVIGAAIGRRVEHAGHVLPATAVAIAADVASVFSPEGVSNVIASDEASLRALVLAFPVPGGEGFTYVVGLGDLVFVALLFGVAVKHGVSRLGVALAVSIGAGAAIAVSAWIQSAVPALVGIGLASVALVPAFRTVRPRERRVVLAACVVAALVVAVVVVRRAW